MIVDGSNNSLHLFEPKSNHRKGSRFKGTFWIEGYYKNWNIRFDYRLVVAANLPLGGTRIEKLEQSLFWLNIKDEE